MSDEELKVFVSSVREAQKAPEFLGTLLRGKSRAKKKPAAPILIDLDMLDL